MNVFRPQKPYVFRPPRYTAALAPLLALVCRGFLRHRFNVTCIADDGAGRIAELVRARHAVLVAPNHADHADPTALVMVGRRHGLAFHFMAAREGFERGPVTRFVLQRLGAFSVDREGADVAAIKAAIGILREGRHPLVIFPEGEIYHHHEQLDALNEGVATIALRAGSRLENGRRVYLVPAAIRFRYHPQVADTFGPRLDRLERRIAWKPRTDLAAVERIYRL
ncbi:MAG: lysophospholipid acyltransferase family protein, partial [Planctomycetota bacterium]